MTGATKSPKIQLTLSVFHICLHVLLHHCLTQECAQNASSNFSNPYLE